MKVDEDPHQDHHHLLFTYWPHEHSAPHVWEWVQRQQAAGIDCWVGSEYCQGLRANMARLKQQGLRGFLTSPIHYSQGYPRLTGEMCDTLAWAVEELSNA